VGDDAGRNRRVRGWAAGGVCGVGTTWRMKKRKQLKLGPRNDPLGLAQRSLVNLEIIEKSYTSTKNGHVVTQLVQSLLALLVFPKEKALYDRLKSWQMVDLANRGWPLPKIVKDDKHDTTTLFKLLWHMRNAVCHGLIKFYGGGPDGDDSRDIRQIAIEFSDRDAPNSPIDWIATIEGENLKKFLQCIVRLIQN
jgi:hypothetical protein